MVVAGIDIGSLSAKSVILKDQEIMGWSLIQTSPDSQKTASDVMEKVLEKAGITMGDIGYVVSTGYGRVNVPFAKRNITEISCHAKGTHMLFPHARTILDMGGQDCKAIRCNEKGRVTNFAMNDKCAAGTGRFLERVARTVGVTLDEMGVLSLKAVEEPVSLRSYCAVFAESDIVDLLRQGKHRNDILAGATEAIAKKIVALLERVGIEETLSISGGVAKNIGVIRQLEERVGMKAHIAFDAQIVGALGAAIFARELHVKEISRKGTKNALQSINL